MALRSHSRVLDLSRLLLLGCCGFSEAQESAQNWVLDDTALIQHAIHRRKESSDLTSEEYAPRILTRDEVADALSHMRGEPGSTNAVEYIKKRKHKEKPVSMDELKMADFAASLTCTAVFAAGIDPQHVDTTVTTDVVQNLRGRQWNRTIDVLAKEVTYQIQDVTSRTWKFVNKRYGCIHAIAWNRSMQLLPLQLKNATLKAGRDNASRNNASAGEVAATENSSHALNDTSFSMPLNWSNLTDADVAVQWLFRYAMIDEDVLALLVLKQGRVFESYCKACGASRDTGLRGFSIGKSIQGLLIRQRRIETRADPDALARVPELEGKRSEWGLTINNLLNMRAACPPDEQEIRASLLAPNDTAQFSAQLTNRHCGVNVGDWYYSSGHTFMNSRELRYTFTANTTDPESELSGELEYADYAWSHLFNAIGAKSFSCSRDAAGNLLFAVTCFATSEDWLRVGKLVLERGKGPDGTQVIAREVIDELFGDMGYGPAKFYINGWYRFDRLFPNWGSDLGPMLAAMGVGGQMLVIVPKFELVLLRQSRTCHGEGGAFFDSRNFGRGILATFLAVLQR